MGWFSSATSPSPPPVLTTPPPPPPPPARAPAHQHGTAVEFPIPGIDGIKARPHLIVRASGPALVMGHVHLQCEHDTPKAWNQRHAKAYPTGMMVLKAPAGALSLPDRSVSVTMHFEVGGEYQIEAVMLFRDFKRNATYNELNSKMFCMVADVHVPVFVARYWFAGVQPSAQRPLAGPGWFADPPSPAYTRMQSNGLGLGSEECKRSGDTSFAPLTERYFGGPNYMLLGVKHAINNYVFGHYDLRAKRVVEAPMYRRRIDGMCAFGGSHSRDLVADIPGGVWIGARFAGSGLFDPAEGLTAVGLSDPSLIEAGYSGKSLQATPLGGLAGHKDHNRTFNLSSCSHLLLLYGQWDAGWPCRPCRSAYDRAHREAAHCFDEGKKGCAPQLKRFEVDVENRIRELDANGLKSRIVLATSNYNGIGCGMHLCPIPDFRIPPVLEVINEILERVAARHNVPFVDMEHIIKPMWDHSVDLCHPAGAVKAALVSRWVDFLCDELNSPACTGPKLPHIHWSDHPPAKNWYRAMR